jgi:hypothetical protein
MNCKLTFCCSPACSPSPNVCCSSIWLAAGRLLGDAPLPHPDGGRAARACDLGATAHRLLVSPQPSRIPLLPA